VDDLAFSPLIPSPPRAARLFGDMNLKSRSHPTMHFKTSNRMPTIYTSNGFCFCVTGSDKCGVSETESPGKLCGFTDTVKSLYDKQSRRSQTLTTGIDRCNDQLDWPYEGGLMRDGTIMTSRTDTDKQYLQPSTCDITDRLPPFWYRYMPNGTITAPSSTSLSKGGTCHMGVAPKIDKGWTYEQGICRKLNETQFNVTVS
jgi:hypothetical protein